MRRVRLPLRGLSDRFVSGLILSEHAGERASGLRRERHTHSRSRMRSQAGATVCDPSRGAGEEGGRDAADRAGRPAGSGGACLGAKRQPQVCAANRCMFIRSGCIRGLYTRCFACFSSLLSAREA